MNIKQNIKQSRTTGIVLISLLYSVLSIYLFNKHGIKVVNDSPRYLEYARDLRSGFYFDPLNFWYFTYVILVYLFQLLSDSLLPIITCQYFIGYFAVLALYKAAEILTQNRLVATVCCLMFILYPDNLFWHSYILTESIYSSFLCFSAYTLIRYLNQNTNKNLNALILTSTVCFFCKPTAPALIIAAITPLIINFLSDKSLRFLKITGVLVAFTATIILANKMISMHHVMLIYEKGDIIFAMHEFPTHVFHDLLTIEATQDLYIPKHKSALILNMAEFIIKNPVYWIKLFCGKLFMYITHIRPYWSWGHNIWVILLIWPCYYFSLVVLKRKLISRPLIISTITYMAIHCLIVSNTWADWDARFFVPIYPILAILGAIGLNFTLESTTRNK